MKANFFAEGVEDYWEIGELGNWEICRQENSLLKRQR